MQKAPKKSIIHFNQEMCYSWHFRMVFSKNVLILCKVLNIWQGNEAPAFEIHFLALIRTKTKSFSSTKNNQVIEKLKNEHV